MQAAYFGHKIVYPGLIDDLLSTTPTLIAVDVETVSLKDRSLVGVGIGLSQTDAMYFPVLPERSIYLDRVVQWLNNSQVTKCFHNCMFDLDILSRLDICEMTNIIDTMIMAQLANYPMKLVELGEAVGTECWDMKEVLGKLPTTLNLPIETLAKKCCLDVQTTMAAYYHLKDLVDMDYVAEEMKVIPVVLNMQHRGLKVDQEVRERLEKSLTRDVEFYAEICRVEGFNPGSYKQVGYILAKRGHHQVVRRVNGKYVYRTGEKIIEKIDDPFASIILNYRDVAKQLSTYVKPLRGLERSYTHFSFETVTRRLASANLNMQNIPKHLRKMFVPDSDVFVEGDFAQQELRILAYVSGDSVMQGVFERGEDIHQATADFMGIDRRIAKNVNFATLYGGSAETIAETGGIRDVRKAVELRRLWIQSYRQAAEWISDVQDFAVQHRRVATIGGAWLYVNREESDDGIRRKGVNYIIQGSAAELTKKAMVRCGRLPMLLQVHDSMLFQGDVRTELERLELDQIGHFRTPMDVKVIGCWE